MVLAIGLVACGGGSGPSGDATASVEATTLLPSASDAPTPLTLSQKPDGQNSDASLLTAYFGGGSKTVAPQLDSLAEADFSGPRSTFAYVHSFVFGTVDDADAATDGFLTTTSLEHALDSPSGAPGDDSQASTETYNTGKNDSFRYAYRDHNVLAYVEVDGPKGTFSLDDAVALATAQDAKIEAALK